GDIHQPLHASALIASKELYTPPFDNDHGDQGGNKLAVRIKPADPDPMILHFYWDSLLFGDEPSYHDVVSVTGRLKTEHPRGELAEMANKEFLDWAEESLKLAKESVYSGSDGFLNARSVPDHADIKFGYVKNFDAPDLPKGYAEAAEAVASRRI